MVRICPVQNIQNYGLRRLVSFGDKVIGIFFIDVCAADFARGAAYQVCCPACCAQSNIQHGRHEKGK